MNVKELKKQLVETNVPEDMYSLVVGGFPNEAFCLVKLDEGQNILAQGDSRTRTTFKIYRID